MEIRELTFRVLAIQSSKRSDEGLTLEMSFSNLFIAAKLSYQHSVDKTKYSLHIVFSYDCEGLFLHLLFASIDYSENRSLRCNESKHTLNFVVLALSRPRGEEGGGGGWGMRIRPFTTLNPNSFFSNIYANLSGKI